MIFALTGTPRLLVPVALGENSRYIVASEFFFLWLVFFFRRFDPASVMDLTYN